MANASAANDGTSTGNGGGNCAGMVNASASSSGDGDGRGMVNASTSSGGDDDGKMANGEGNDGDGA